MMERVIYTLNMLEDMKDKLELTDEDVSSLQNIVNKVKIYDEKLSSVNDYNE